MRAGSLLAVLVVTGCAAWPSAAPEVRLTAASEYGRHAAVQGKVDLYIANVGPAPVDVASYQVRHPMFEVVPATERASIFPAVRLASGEELVLPLPDREPGLLRAHRLACAAEAVQQVAKTTLGPPYVRDGGVVRTVLRLGGGPRERSWCRSCSAASCSASTPRGWSCPRAPPPPRCRSW